jgi:hypothetical protein
MQNVVHQKRLDMVLNLIFVLTLTSSIAAHMLFLHFVGLPFGSIMGAHGGA